MDKQTLEKLEYHKIKENIHGKCYTPLGISKVEKLYPQTEYAIIKRTLDETHEMFEILSFEEPFVLQTLDPIDEYLNRLKIELTFLNPLEYYKISHFIAVIHAIHSYMSDKKEKYPLISEYTNELTSAKEIAQKIEKAIDRTGEIKDNASTKLRKIRIDKHVVRNRIITKLEALIQGSKSSSSRQDDLVTIRDDRYVIPVSTSDFNSKTGVIHGRSKSGATFFIEPMVTVEMNNHLRSLINDEEEEIERILVDIGDSIRLRMNDLHKNYQLAGQIDFIHAKAKLAVQLDCNRPELTSQPLLDLKKTRHPLLLLAAEKPSQVIPMDINLGIDFDCLVITGPNMGGKTVALKTVGLFVLMAQSGILIPADRDSKIGIFKQVFADIGDEQSIELSLSTFSSHISRIISSLKHCDKSSLILMDELGAGTDPLEGSALGEAILKRIIELGGKSIITTHYSALKTLAESNERIHNASLEFNHESLTPTYRLLIGLPGSSYAIEMAKRLGMPDEIIDEANRLIGSQERSLGELIERLQTETRAAKLARDEIDKQLTETEKTRDHYFKRMNKLKAEEKKLRADALQEAQNIIETTRTNIEHLVKQIKENKADKSSVRQVHNFIKEKQAEFEKQISGLTPAKESKKEHLSPGDKVFIENLQTHGELLDYIENNDCWRVQTGSMVATIKSELLRKTDQPANRKHIPTGVNYAPFDDISMQLSVRGLLADEAIEAVEKYLDSVSIANLEKVFILHGKGTGALRKAISTYLKTHPMVASFRLGYFNEGGAGVTVVKLKRD